MKKLPDTYEEYIDDCWREGVGIGLTKDRVTSHYDRIVTTGEIQRRFANLARNKQ